MVSEAIANLLMHRFFPITNVGMILFLLHFSIISGLLSQARCLGMWRLWHNLHWASSSQPQRWMLFTLLHPNIHIKNPHHFNYKNSVDYWELVRPTLMRQNDVVIDKPVEFKNQLIEVQDFMKNTCHSRRLLISSLHVLECSFHVRYKWVVMNVSITCDLGCFYFQFI